MTGVDYAFEGVPTSVPVGTTFSFTNAGAEAHEMVIMRKNDGVTESFDEILALPDEEAFTKITIVGFDQANPGASGAVPVTTAAEGEHLMICFIPQGTLTIPEGSPAPSGLESPGTESPAAGSPAAGSPSASPPSSPGATGEASPGASPGAPPHFVLGMAQEFMVTAAGSTPGPIASPGTSPGGSPGASVPASSPTGSPEASATP